MNINEFYGDITIPSDIADSFEATNFLHQDEDSSPNLDSSIEGLEDTFLERVKIQHNKKTHNQ